MITVRGKVSGGKELAKAFHAFDKALQEKILISAARNVAGQVRKDFKAATPRSPETDRSPASKEYEHAQDNVTARRRRKQRTTVRVHWGSAFWMRFREFGTSHQPPRPVMRPLWDTNVQSYTDRFVKALATAMKREAKKIAGTYGKARKALGVKGKLFR